MTSTSHGGRSRPLSSSDRRGSSAYEDTSYSRAPSGSASGSAMGCRPATERSRIASRRQPYATAIRADIEAGVVRPSMCQSITGSGTTRRMGVFTAGVKYPTMPPHVHAPPGCGGRTYSGQVGCFKVGTESQRDCAPPSCCSAAIDRAGIVSALPAAAYSLAYYQVVRLAALPQHAASGAPSISGSEVRALHGPLPRQAGHGRDRPGAAGRIGSCKRV